MALVDGPDPDPMASPHNHKTSDLWRTARGQVVHIATMDDSHVINCCRMLRMKAILARAQTLGAAIHGRFMYKAGIPDADDVTHYHQKTWEDFADKSFFRIKQEAARRGLNWEDDLEISTVGRLISETIDQVVQEMPANVSQRAERSINVGSTPKEEKKRKSR